MPGEIWLTLTGEPCIAGGTRSPVTNRMINRPWQPSKPERLPNCPFCVENGRMEQLYANGEVLTFYPEGTSLIDYRFAAIRNTMTPYPYHELLVPRIDEPLWPWNDVDYLVGVLEIIVERTRLILACQDYTNVAVGFHYGQTAGQNLGHPHWHLIGSDWEQPKECFWCKWPTREEFVYGGTDNLIVLLDGIRAGQTVVVSRDHHWNWHQNLGEIALLLLRITSLFHQRFDDPDFILSTAFKRGGHFWFEYVPMLNHLGYTNFLALRGLEAFTHPCSPQEMLKYLKTCQR